MRLPPGPYRILHDCLPSQVSVLRFEPLKDPLRRMSLLLWSLLVGDKDLMNDRQHRGQYRPRPCLTLPIPRRLSVSQNLLQRMPAQLVLLARRSMAQPVYQDLLTNLFPILHVTSHFGAPRQSR